MVSAKEGNFIKSQHLMNNVSRVIALVVVVQVGAVKIHVAAVKALRKTERHDETQFTTKIGGKN
jgi:hypothetical protein